MPFRLEGNKAGIPQSLSLSNRSCRIFSIESSFPNPSSFFSVLNTSLRLSKYSSDKFSESINEFVAFSVDRSNSSNFRCMAALSRFWVFWIKNTIKNVIIVVPVLITNCQVSENLQTGPVDAQTTTSSTADKNVQELPAAFDVLAANLRKRVFIMFPCLL